MDFGKLKKQIAEHTGVSIEKMDSQSRLRSIVNARLMLWYIAKVHLGMTLEEIGKSTGGRHHTTVLNGIRVFIGELGYNHDLNKSIKKFEQQNFSRWTGQQTT